MDLVAVEVAEADEMVAVVVEEKVAVEVAVVAAEEMVAVVVVEEDAEVVVVAEVKPVPMLQLLVPVPLDEAMAEGEDHQRMLDVVLVDVAKATNETRDEHRCVSEQERRAAEPHLVDDVVVLRSETDRPIRLPGWNLRSSERPFNCQKVP